MAKCLKRLYPSFHVNDKIVNISTFCEFVKDIDPA